jgi:membrane-bound metal-dependent hydrolase YbcI (DUF457 family)
MAIAYLLGKGSAKALRTKLNIPLLLVLSILPDIDIVYDYLTGAEIHRGPTHSLIFAAVMFIPFLVYYRKKAVPYFLALLSHSLIGDFFVGGQLRLLWPLSRAQFGAHEMGFPFINIFDTTNIVIEVTLFVVASAVLFKTHDWKVFFTANLSSLVLIVPITTVLLPSTIGYPFSTSLLVSAPILAFAHLFYLALFSIAVLKTIVYLYMKWFKPHKDKVEDSNGNGIH